MERFPLLSVYRTLLQVAAVLIIVFGFFGAVGSANETQPYSDETDFSLGVFLMVFGFAVVAGISLLVTAELIQLGVSIEDHLFSIRHSMSYGKSRPSVSTPYSSTLSSDESQSRSSTRAYDMGPKLMPPIVTPQNLYDQGVAAYRQEKYRLASDYFEQAEAAGGDFPAQFYYYRSESYRQLGDIEKAEHDMQRYQEKADPSGKATAPQGSTSTPLIMGIVITERTVLRKEPRDYADAFAVAMRGNGLKIVARNSDSTWVKVQHKGEQNWVNVSELQIDADISQLPLA